MTAEGVFLPMSCRKLVDEGIRVSRVSHSAQLPMHAKFLIVDRGGHTGAWLGSHNFNNKSAKKNAELLLRTSDCAVIAALVHRFEQIALMS